MGGKCSTFQRGHMPLQGIEGNYGFRQLKGRIGVPMVRKATRVCAAPTLCQINCHTMVGCTAFGCTNRSEKGVRMYGFPKDMDRRKKWLAMVSRSNLTIKRDYNNRKLCQENRPWIMIVQILFHPFFPIAPETVQERWQDIKEREGRTKLKPLLPAPQEKLRQILLNPLKMKASL
ncbi:uncharacterized protein LOC130108456 isoform X3 [Lampris incognitus]|uniref:uncharacterized protein LOC130108456 isoform X3 n=1 Tax=Lampris incognitus TaxID=2546036 RepID=UPI0024B604FE|nr:uncharacterized protein LOC130108456 isoform X3 [Lampris incognitus]